ncbi:MAG: cytidine deaminase [Verrucomicrobia bacterium]|nr:cytidine deaminase [Verrucomicrobiota bacterium]
MPKRKATDRAAFEQAALIAAALAARNLSFSPYSRFKVGAALLTRDGEIIGGANVESASYGLTCCAERVALFKAITEGRTEFRAVAIVAEAPGGPMPCGACRQLLAEFAPDAILWVADSRRPRRVREFTVEELIPLAFRKFRPAPAGKKSRGMK